MPNIVLPPTAVIEVQEGGAGATNWQTLAAVTELSHLRFGAIDSGEIEIARQYARNLRTGALTTISSWRTGEAPTYTGELEINDINVRRLLEILNGKNNYRVRYYTGAYGDPTNYELIRQMSSAWNMKPAGGFGTDMVNSFEGYDAPADPQRRTFPLEADNFLEIPPLLHTKQSGTVIAANLSHIISVGYPRYAGQVQGEYANNAGNKEFIAVSNALATVPQIVYTLDQGATWTVRALTGITTADATGVALAGDNLVISMSGTNAGLVWTKWSEVKANSYTVTRSTNISAGTVINRVVACSNKVLYACGNSGAIYKSTDGGVTFNSVGTAVTANNLTRIAYATEDVAWFGGASGTLVRYRNGVQSLITVGSMGAVTINALAVPNMAYNRLGQLYIGNNGGDVFVCYDGDATAPTFTRVYEGPSSVAAIDGLDFAGPNGDVLWVIETNGSTQSRVSIDLSGGKFGQDLKPIASYTDPANSTFDHIAAADHYTAMVVGPVNSSQGYLGLISA